MKVSLLSAWNSDSGAAIHAESVAREWIKMGHEVSVFSFIKTDFHGKNILREDEPYVTRCFGTSTGTDFFNSKPILAKEADIVVVEDLGMLPKAKLLKIWPEIKKRSKTINVIHDNKVSTDPDFFKFNWDKVIVFNERYKKIFVNKYSKSILGIINYPCTPWKIGDELKARKKLHLPRDKKIIFVFAWWAKTVLPYFLVFININKKYPLHFLVVSKDKTIQADYKMLKNNGIALDFREQILSIEDLFDYLHASNVFVFGKKDKEGALIPSTCFMTLGAGCPIVVPNINFFSALGKEVMKYEKPEELEKAIIDVFERKERCEDTLKLAEQFVKNNDEEVIAKQFIDLFESLLIKR